MISAVTQASPMVILLAFIVISIMLLLTIIALIVLVSYFQKLFDRQDIQIKLLHEDLAAVCNGAVGVGAHLAQMDAQIRTLIERQDHLELQETPEYSYKQAIRLARKGADVNQLIDDCGLAQGEAELAMLVEELDKAN